MLENILSKVISIRIDPSSLAKALDGLKVQKINPAEINSPGKIAKFTFYYGLLSLLENPYIEPSEESIKSIIRMLKK